MLPAKIEPLKIDLIENNVGFDVCNRYYRRALLNSLICLKPKYCLEIGTFIYQSSQVFSYYFNKYCPEGKLITTDVAEWNRGNAPLGVYPIMVYPHTLDVEQRHGGIQIYHPDWKKKLEFGGNSVQINGKIIQDKMDELGINEFDFTFLDSDHSRDGFYSDLYLSQILTSGDGYLLIDDIEDTNNAQRDIFHNELKHKNEFYTFCDWEQDTPVGMAIIRAGDLNI